MRHCCCSKTAECQELLGKFTSFARGYLGVAYSFGGEPDRSLAALEEAIRLSPRDFLMVIWHTASAWSQLHAEHRRNVSYRR